VRKPYVIEKLGLAIKKDLTPIPRFYKGGEKEKRFLVSLEMTRRSK